MRPQNAELMDTRAQMVRQGYQRTLPDYFEDVVTARATHIAPVLADHPDLGGAIEAREAAGRKLACWLDRKDEAARLRRFLRENGWHSGRVSVKMARGTNQIWVTTRVDVTQEDLDDIGKLTGHCWWPHVRVIGDAAGSHWLAKYRKQQQARSVTIPGETLEGVREWFAAISSQVRALGEESDPEHGEELGSALDDFALLFEETAPSDPILEPGPQESKLRRKADGWLTRWSAAKHGPAEVE